MKILNQQLTMDQIRKGFYRRDDCKGYDTCLKMAAMLKVKSFSCKDCKLYRPSAKHQPEIPNKAFTPLAIDWN